MCEEGVEIFAGERHRGVGAGQSTLLVGHELVIMNAPEVS